MNAYEQQVIRCGSYTSVKDLNAKLRTYIDGWNDRAHPFAWTKAAEKDILKKANRKKISSVER